MKKMVASIATGVILAGATMTTASAADYDVEKGDNLWGIAQDHDTTVNELVDINDLKTTIIQPKQTLNINEDNETYTVEKGDTLYAISHEFDVTVADLKEWNDLDSDIIQIGQGLHINGTAVNQDEEVKSASTNQNASAQTNETEQAQASKSDKTKDNQKSSQSNQKSSQNKPDGKTVSVTATAYTADCDGCSGITATGVNLNANPNKKVIAVDPDVIPLGTEVYVEGYGRATAADTGGAINGNKIDVHVASESKANNWGVQNVNVTILN
ncbi:resuscitation-promoting factor [Barrientosiimonas marina]|uniref:LysM peptidoglycan-binding domain-containing protein n=1 Tax=Lentibacillus kimchii TaxID=1542911 RepID=A0ABW2UZD2_9BACI